MMSNLRRVIGLMTMLFVVVMPSQASACDVACGLHAQGLGCHDAGPGMGRGQAMAAHGQMRMSGVSSDGIASVDAGVFRQGGCLDLRISRLAACRHAALSESLRSANGAGIDQVQWAGVVVPPAVRAVRSGPRLMVAARYLRCSPVNRSLTNLRV